MRRSQDLTVCTTLLEFINILGVREWNTVRKNRYSNVDYIDTTSTLDIESTNTPEDGFAYSFALNVGGVNYQCSYVEDMVRCLDQLIEEFECHANRRLVIYIQNLGYEAWYLTQILDQYIGVDEQLLTKSHKPLYIRFKNGLELRDSLKLFQKSLAKATKGLPHEKMSGDLDYRKYRTPDTPLSPDEWNYIINDVQGLYEAIEKLKKDHGFNQATIPYTNTSMVIGELNRQIKGSRETFTAMRDLRLTKHQMKLAYNCMAGGDTHGTRWRAGITFKNCNSYDFKSAHPSQMLLRDYPVGVPYDMEDVSEDMMDALIDMKQGFIARMVITRSMCRPECPDPTISVSKCPAIEGSEGIDNGRLLGAAGVICYMDSNDYQRFKMAYQYETIEALELTAFDLKPLPEAFRKAIFDKFKAKELSMDDVERVFSKICVNTIFGACAQKTVRDEYVLDIDSMEIAHTSWQNNLDGKSDDEVLKSQKKKFPFLWGLWTSSLTRLELFKMLKIVGWENVVYWDTDSCKYEGEKKAAIELYNKGIRDLCVSRNAIFIRDSREICIGSAEDEHPEDVYGYTEFRFLHAKCYAARTRNGVETTIAGVGKLEGVKALNGNLDNLDDGLYIADAGGNKLHYITRPVTTRKEWKRETVTASFIYMEPRDYRTNWVGGNYLELKEDEIIA